MLSENPILDTGFQHMCIQLQILNLKWNEENLCPKRCVSTVDMSRCVASFASILTLVILPQYHFPASRFTSNFGNVLYACILYMFCIVKNTVYLAHVYELSETDRQTER